MYLSILGIKLFSRIEFPFKCLAVSVIMHPPCHGKLHQVTDPIPAERKFVRFPIPIGVLFLKRFQHFIPVFRRYRHIEIEFFKPILPNDQHVISPTLPVNKRHTVNLAAGTGDHFLCIGELIYYFLQIRSILINQFIDINQCTLLPILFDVIRRHCNDRIRKFSR